MHIRNGIVTTLHAYSADSEFTIFGEDAPPLAGGEESPSISFNKMLI